MQKILWNGVSGISSQMLRLDTVANNLANINTSAFKAQYVAFSDLVYQELSASGKPVNNGAKSIYSGSGSRVAEIPRDFSPGVMVKSNNPYSIAIAGKGFFRVQNEEGDEFYTRDGNFHRNAAGYLVNASGKFLPGIRIDEDAVMVLIHPDGTVESLDSSGNATRVGRVNLYLFNNPQGLKAAGENLFTATPQSGTPQKYVPGENGTGRLKQGFVEMSNTNVTTEMVKLINTQRTIQLNAQSVRIADQLWDMANNIRR